MFRAGMVGGVSLRVGLLAVSFQRFDELKNSKILVISEAEFPSCLAIVSQCYYWGALRTI
jgi:hypothetical protein